MTFRRVWACMNARRDPLRFLSTNVQAFMSAHVSSQVKSLGRPCNLEMSLSFLDTGVSAPFPFSATKYGCKLVMLRYQGFLWLLVKSIRSYRPRINGQLFPKCFPGNSTAAYSNAIRVPV